MDKILTQISFTQHLYKINRYNYSEKELHETDTEYLDRLRDEFKNCRDTAEIKSAILNTKELLQLYIKKGISGFGTSEGMYLIMYCQLSPKRNLNLNFCDLCHTLCMNQYLPDEYRQKLFQLSMLENPTINDLNLL